MTTQGGVEGRVSRPGDLNTWARHLDMRTMDVMTPSSGTETCHVYWGSAECALPRGHDAQRAVRPHRRIEPVEQTVTVFTACLFGEDLTDDERGLVDQLW